ncbi:hypothetical protein [Streptomyces griseiscabiei]|uniref:hypothetical protein n=1 Tax=Streptomyces griseiscabiei TaxID=2993540 RepID=UPI00226589C8|nr:hypothetical protein [Streptomyces griseiscabiei]MBZ3904013.1 hypothetical protein [Streptomyces griseiscabiei]
MANPTTRACGTALTALPAPVQDEVQDNSEDDDDVPHDSQPRRTTLAHLADAEDLRTPEQEHSVDLPSVTANPRRTVLMTVPVQPAE